MQGEDRGETAGAQHERVEDEFMQDEPSSLAEPGEDDEQVRRQEPEG
jgi:hypothetical protein